MFTCAVSIHYSGVCMSQVCVNLLRASKFASSCCEQAGLFPLLVCVLYVPSCLNHTVTVFHSVVFPSLSCDRVADLLHHGIDIDFFFSSHIKNKTNKKQS